MSVQRHKIAAGFFAVLAGASLAGVVPAVASKPVPKTIVGCVFNGSFVSSDGYVIHPRDADGQEIDLRPFEGHQVTVSGDLLPGDAFILKRPPAASGPCKIGKNADVDSSIAPAAPAVKVTTGGDAEAGTISLRVANTASGCACRTDAPESLQDDVASFAQPSRRLRLPCRGQ